MKNFYKRKNKSGFSLFEVVVTMSIVAVFVAACANVFTMRKRERVTVPAHGRMECYYVRRPDDTLVLHQRLFYNNTLSQDDDLPAHATRCEFAPSSSATFLIVSIVGGGGAGSPDVAATADSPAIAGRGGSAGQFKNEFIPVTTHRLFLVPGRGAEYTAQADEQQDGEASTVLDAGVYGGNVNPPQIVRVNGGVSAARDASYRLGNCVLTYQRFNCGLEQTCEYNNETQEAKVGYCTSNNVSDNFAWKDVPFADILSQNNIANIVPNSLITYNDEIENGDICSTSGNIRNFSFAINIIGNVTEDEEISHMDEYINSLGIQGGIRNVRAGNGGKKYTTENAAQANGGTGAVIVVW